VRLIPFRVFIKTGKYAAIKITATLLCSPMPNQIINRGTHASIGICRIDVKVREKNRPPGGSCP
jgi:hypothetical protein